MSNENINNINLFDPRENILVTSLSDSGTTTGYYLEESNRNETMYSWGSSVVDLCDLPVSEYMKNPFNDGV